MICVSLVRLFLHSSFDTTALWSIFMMDVLEFLSDDVNTTSSQSSRLVTLILILMSMFEVLQIIFWLNPEYSIAVIRDGILGSLPF